MKESGCQMLNSIKHRLLGSALFFLKYFKVHRLLYPVFAGNGVILVLHRVLPATNKPRIKENSRIEITPEFLEKLILFFKKKNYQIISLDDLYENLRANKKDRPFVCFTFDDGYVDIHDIIYPIFKRYQAPFTVYVATFFPERTAVPWWYMLEDLVLNYEQVGFSYRQNKYFFSTVSTMEKEAAYDEIRSLILKNSQDEFEDFIDAIFSPYNISAREYHNQLMSWWQINKLNEDPLVTIGAHTVHHMNLKQLKPQHVRDEILGSKLTIEQKTGGSVHHFAYPFGSKAEVGGRECDIAASCNFKTMTVVREGNIFSAHRNHFNCLPRIEITGRHQDLTLVDLRLCGVVSLLRNGWRRVVTV